MIHLTKKAKELCKQLKRDGFQGVPVKVVRVHTDSLGAYKGEITPEEHDIKLRDSVCFGIELDVPKNIDRIRFFDDMIRWFDIEFGPGVVLDFRPEELEFEAIRE